MPVNVEGAVGHIKCIKLEVKYQDKEEDCIYLSLLHGYIELIGS